MWYRRQISPSLWRSTKKRTRRCLACRLRAEDACAGARHRPQRRPPRSTRELSRGPRTGARTGSLAGDRVAASRTAISSPWSDRWLRFARARERLRHLVGHVLDREAHRHASGLDGSIIAPQQNHPGARGKGQGARGKGARGPASRLIAVAYRISQRPDGVADVVNLHERPAPESAVVVDSRHPERPRGRHLGRLVAPLPATYLDEQVQQVLGPVPVVHASNDVGVVEVLVAVQRVGGWSVRPAGRLAKAGAPARIDRYAGVAQLVRARGSYPRSPGFKSLHRHQCGGGVARRHVRPLFVFPARLLCRSSHSRIASGAPSSATA